MQLLSLPLLESVATEPLLIYAFLEYGNLDNCTKAALRLCNKQIKAAIDATIISCSVEPGALTELPSCECHLNELCIKDDRDKWSIDPQPDEFRVTQPSDLVHKFPLLRKFCFEDCNTIRVLPETIGDLSHLKKFKMCSVHNLKALPTSFGQLTTLEVLKLTDCEHLTADGLAPIQHLQQLKQLHLDLEMLEGMLEGRPILEWVCNCYFPSLEHLHLTGVEAVPASIANFEHLTSLMLHGIEDLKVSDSLGSLSSLQKLTLSSYIIQGANHLQMPNSFSKLTTLDKLNIYASFEDIGPFQYFTRLTELRLRSTRGEDSYPSFLWDLTSLKVLTLSSFSGLRSLPDALGNLYKLEFLSLFGSNLVHLPESIGNLSCLTKLEIDSIRPETLPDSIGNLSALKFLKISCCFCLQTLPESIGNLVNLEKLSIHKNEKLFQLPHFIGNLKSLEELVLTLCSNLTELPESLGNLKSLKKLELDYCCKIFQLPESIGNLKSLESMVLRCVELTRLPESIGNLDALKTLDVKGCGKLDYLPESFTNLFLAKSDGTFSLEHVQF